MFISGSPGLKQTYEISSDCIKTQVISHCEFIKTAAEFQLFSHTIVDGLNAHIAYSDDLNISDSQYSSKCRQTFLARLTIIIERCLIFQAGELHKIYFYIHKTSFDT